jgi:deazaflavin-dependent oxidoreductase (nitroreductase family)
MVRGTDENEETMSLQRSITDIGFKVLNKVHRTALRLSGGRIGQSGYGMPVVDLYTVGRKTGQTRVTVLTSPVHSEDRVLLVASKYGDDRNPQWYGNLTANPEVEILIDGQRRQLRARTATADERTKLWSEILKAYKGYGAYQEKTDREIPVVVCEPRPA